RHDPRHGRGGGQPRRDLPRPRPARGTRRPDRRVRTPDHPTRPRRPTTRRHPMTSPATHITTSPPTAPDPAWARWSTAWTRAARRHWLPPPSPRPNVAAVAAILEESRCELRQRQRRPRDRQWLRHAVRAIVAPSMTPPDSRWDAAWAAGLVLARVDTRVLTS